MTSSKSSTKKKREDELMDESNSDELGDAVLHLIWYHPKNIVLHPSTIKLLEQDRISINELKQLYENMPNRTIIHPKDFTPYGKKFIRYR